MTQAITREWKEWLEKMLPLDENVTPSAGPRMESFIIGPNAMSLRSEESESQPSDGARQPVAGAS